MTLEINTLSTNKANFDKLVSRGYRLMKLTDGLTPLKKGWREGDFEFETEFCENTNYGIVGGSEHTALNGEKGKLVFSDFDVKEKITGEGGKTKTVIVHEDAVSELESVFEILKNKHPVYLDCTKNRGAHMGIITNENIPQGVNNYQSQNCEKLHVDIRTELGYVVAIAPGYSIEKIPDKFNVPVKDFDDFMYSLDFKPVNNISKNGKHSGSLSENFKTKARKMIKKMDVSEFPEFGTDAIGTHDVISFLTMSQRSTNIPEDEAVEKIMELLSRIKTDKDNPITEEEIHKMYNKDYEGFEKNKQPEFKADEYIRLEREKEATPLEQVERYVNTQVKDDPEIVSQLVRIGLSAYTDNPINVFLLAPSGDGKTYGVVKTMENFPKEDVILIGRMTPTALIYQHGELIDNDGNPIQKQLDDLDEKIIGTDDKKEKESLIKQRKVIFASARRCVDLKNKILVWLDNPQPQTFEMLKPIMSHDTKEIIYKGTKSDGSLQGVESVIRNWPVFIFCSAKNEAKNEVWEEIKTRVMMTSPNSSVKKYKAANQYTAQKMGLPAWASSIYHNDEDEKWAKWHIQEFKKILNDACDAGNPITIPFHEQLAELFPSNRGEFMRHLPRLISFIKLETLLNSDRRPVFELETERGKFRTIISTIDDVDKACQVLGNISDLPPEKIKFYQDIFCRLCDEKMNQNQSTLDGPWLTSSELAEEYTKRFHKLISSKQVLENYLTPLTDAGVLIKDDESRQNKYSRDGKLTIHNIRDLKSKVIEQSNVIDSGVRSCLEELVQCSTKVGKTMSKITYNNTTITTEQLIQVVSGFPSNVEGV